MSTALTTQAGHALRRAAVKATLAPSVHNTQPWRFSVSGEQVEVVADWDRQLRVLDPTGRQLVISCGCALFNARVAVAGAGFHDEVDRHRDPERPSVLARVRVGAAGAADPALTALEPFLEMRQTNRRRFVSDDVPQDVVDALVAAAAAEGARLIPVLTEEHRYTVARLSQLADKEQYGDPAYRAELRAWTTSDPQRRDGVPAMAVPHVDGTSQDDIPIRDFDTHGNGWLPPETRSSMHQTLFLLGTESDDTGSWLRAGEALERVLLEVTRHEFAASPLTQIVENSFTREQLRAELGLDVFPHVLLRVGKAPLTPSTRRRRLVEVVLEND